MRIIITQPGWAGFTGLLGTVQFQDGISIEDLGRGDIQQIAAVVTVEEFKDGKATGFNPSIAQTIIDHRTLRAEVVPARVAEPEPVKAPAKIYTEDELAAVADAKGIAGIRDIADDYGQKGKSIAELIGKILTAQAEAVAKAAAAADAAAVEAAKAAQE